MSASDRPTCPCPAGSYEQRCEALGLDLTDARQATLARALTRALAAEQENMHAALDRAALDRAALECKTT